MENMKKCPFCGSNIKAEAKKCRYCKKWLPTLDIHNHEKTNEEFDDEIEPEYNYNDYNMENDCAIENESKEKIESLDTYISSHISLIVSVLFVSEFITTFKDIVEDSSSIGIWKYVYYVPEWCYDLLSYICWVLIGFALFIGLKNNKEIVGNARFNCVIQIPLYLMAILGYIIESDIFNLLLLIITIVFISNNLVIGMKLRRLYKNNLKDMGTSMLLYYSIVPILTIIFSSFSVKGIDMAYFLGSIVLLYVYVRSLYIVLS